MAQIAPQSIPVSVIIVTKNEETRLAQCLAALSAFAEIWVLDSSSTDRTIEIAKSGGAQTQNFIWNGAYPKKRQWSLQHLPLAYDRVFFVDADEIVTPELIGEIAALDWSCAGYFVRGRYVFDGQILQHGLHNNKLALFDRRKIEFPVVDDLGLPGMGEIEGHYQPVLKAGHAHEKLGQLRAPLIHQAYDDAPAWLARHQRYAAWEAGMNARRAWPQEPQFWRRFMKACFRRLPFRGGVAFAHSYILKAGFLDGLAGLRFALSRARYYRMISDASKDWAQPVANSTAEFAARK